VKGNRTVQLTAVIPHRFDFEFDFEELSPQYVRKGNAATDTLRKL